MRWSHVRVLVLWPWLAACPDVMGRRVPRQQKQMHDNTNLTVLGGLQKRSTVGSGVSHGDIC